MQSDKPENDFSAMDAEADKRNVIDLSNEEHLFGDEIDIFGQEIIGEASSPHAIERPNFENCVFNGNRFIEIEFTNQDVKGCTFRNVYFDGGKNEEGAISNSIFLNVSFVGVEFSQGIFQDCRFFNCDFTECDLGNLVVKNCRFSDCRFEHCTTETHIFSDCLFRRTNFTECELQHQIITKNYGLSNRSTPQCSFRNQRRRSGGVIEPVNHFIETTLRNGNVLDRLKTKYFQAGTLIEGADELDQCFESSNWIGGAYNDTTIGLAVQLFSEHLISLWDDDELGTIALLKMHQLTAELVQQLKQYSEVSEFDALSSQILGCHMLLSQKLELFFDIFRFMQSDDPIVYIVHGPPDSAYYVQEYPELFSRDDVKILAAVPHNSPSELIVIGSAVLFCFLASLQKVKLSTYKIQQQSVRENALINSEDAVTPNSSLALPTGVSIDYEKGKPLELDASFFIPFSSVLIDMQLTFSSRFFGRLGKLLVNLFQDDNSDSEQ